MAKQQLRNWLICGLAVTLNIVLGQAVAYLQLPLLYLDSIGTIFIGAVFGIGMGMLTGLVTNLLLGLLVSPLALPFALFNMAVGLIAGLVFRGKVTAFKGLITGLAITFFASIISVPLRIWLFNGMSSPFTNGLILGLKARGVTFPLSVYAGAVVDNLFDKVLSGLLVYRLVTALEKQHIIQRDA